MFSDPFKCIPASEFFYIHEHLFWVLKIFAERDDTKTSIPILFCIIDLVLPKVFSSGRDEIQFNSKWYEKFSNA